MKKIHLIRTFPLFVPESEFRGDASGKILIDGEVLGGHTSSNISWLRLDLMRKTEPGAYEVHDLLMTEFADYPEALRPDPLPVRSSPMLPVGESWLIRYRYEEPSTEFYSRDAQHIGPFFKVPFIVADTDGLAWTAVYMAGYNHGVNGR